MTSAGTVDAQRLEHFKVWRPDSDDVVTSTKIIADFRLSTQ